MFDILDCNRFRFSVAPVLFRVRPSSGPFDPRRLCQTPGRDRLQPPNSPAKALKRATVRQASSLARSSSLLAGGKSAQGLREFSLAFPWNSAIISAYSFLHPLIGLQTALSFDFKIDCGILLDFAATY